MRRKLAVVVAALVIPVGGALAATVATATPAQAVAQNCGELADAYLYHMYHGNYEYAAQLAEWYYSAGCGAA